MFFEFAAKLALLNRKVVILDLGLHSIDHVLGFEKVKQASGKTLLRALSAVQG